MLYSGSELDAASAIYVMVPGALTPVSFFDPAKRIVEEGAATIFYRLPGLDGLPLDHQVEVESAADNIAGLLNAYPDKPIKLIGYSLGGAILISTASRLQHKNVKVAAISTAVEHGGGYETTLRAMADLTGAAIRAASFDRRQVWREYYRTLLFGRAGLKDKDRRQQADEIWRQEKTRIVYPEGDMPDAHSKNLRRWSLPEGYAAPSARIRIYAGAEDPVFSTAQTHKFADKIGAERVVIYEGHGHLLPISKPDVYDDVAAFFEDVPL